MAGEGEVFKKAVFVGTTSGALDPAKALTVRGVGATWVEVAWERARCNGLLIMRITL